MPYIFAQFGLIFRGKKRKLIEQKLFFLISRLYFTVRFKVFGNKSVFLICESSICVFFLSRKTQVLDETFINFDATLFKIVYINALDLL